VETAYQELSKTIEIQPDHYAAHLDLANLLILGRHYGEAKQHLDVLAKTTQQSRVYTARSNYDAGVTTPRPRWRTCRRRCNWIPRVTTCI
jgi:predicted Zn-dependent protease